MWQFEAALFYSYLNLENTKTELRFLITIQWFYSYLNLENTKTIFYKGISNLEFYSYLNLENTKTSGLIRK